MHEIFHGVLSADTLDGISRAAESTGLEYQTPSEIIQETAREGSTILITGRGRESVDRFLELKQTGKLVDGYGSGRVVKPAGAVTARLNSAISLHTRPRGFLADTDGTLVIEGTHRRFRVVPGASDVAGEARDAALAPGPIEMFAAAPGMAVVVHGGDIRAIEPTGGEVRWTLPGRKLADLGRILNVKTTGSHVVVGGTKGIRAFKLSDGSAQWHRLGEWMTFDVSDSSAAIVGPSESGQKQLEMIDPASGRTVVRVVLPTSTLWHAPVLTDGLVLLTDSLNGRVIGFDRRTGLQRFAFDMKQVPIRPLTIVGDVALMHSMREGRLSVAALDLKFLRISFDVMVTDGKESLGGVSSKPLVWRNRLLYHNPRTNGLMALDVETGKVAGVMVSPKTTAIGTAGGGFRWTLIGDTLCIIGSGGELQFWKLAVTEN